MSTHNIGFYEEMMKIIFQLSSVGTFKQGGVHLICRDFVAIQTFVQTYQSLLVSKRYEDS